MKPESLTKTSRTPPLADKTIYVVGSSQLQNSLMSTFLEETTGAACHILQTFDQVRADNICSNNHKCLVLWDCLGKDWASCMLEFDNGGDEVLNHIPVALFNVSPDLGIEDKAIAYGVEGIFYDQYAMEDLEKGIRAIFAGELWISRRVLAEYMRKNNSPNKPPNTRKIYTPLTPRETDILIMVASGATNAEVADKLFISPHTVRTHLFNIYKKINVPNRFQAMLWAAENL